MTQPRSSVSGSRRARWSYGGLAGWAASAVEVDAPKAEPILCTIDLSDATLSVHPPPSPWTDLVPWHVARLLLRPEDLAARVLMARRRKFGGRTFLLWAEDAAENSMVMLHALDEATGARGNLSVHDDDLREVYSHFAQSWVSGLSADLGLCQGSGNNLIMQPSVADNDMLWPSTVSEPLLNELVTRLLDAVYFEANSFGDEWSIRLPGLGPRSRGERSGRGMGPALRLAVCSDALLDLVPRSAAATAKNGAGMLPQSPVGRGQREELDPSSSPPNSAQPQQQPLLPAQRTPPWQGHSRSSVQRPEEVPTSHSALACAHDVDTSSLAARLTSAMLLRDLESTETGAEGFPVHLDRREDRAATYGICSPPSPKPPWRPTPRYQEYFGGANLLTEQILTPPPRPRSSRSFPGRRPKSANKAWGPPLEVRRITPLDAGIDSRSEIAHDQVGVALDQGVALNGPCLPPSPPPRGKPRARHSFRDPQVPSAAPT